MNDKTGEITPYNANEGDPNAPITTNFDDGKITGKEVSNDILSGNTVALASKMEYGVPYDCGDRSQCGERYNDAVGTKNGTHVGSEYKDKTKFIDPSITVGTPWMGVVFNPWGKYEKRGHVGVIASWPYEKNGVVGYDMISANYTTADKLSKDFVSEAKIASSWGGFIPTKVSEATKFTGAQENQFKNYNGNSIPEEYKTPKAKQVFLDNYSKRKSENPQFLNKDERAEVNKVIDNLAQDPSYKAYETIKSKEMAFQEIVTDLKNSAATAQDKQALISDFAKALDPTSVVREGEYALAGKYSQSKLAAYKQEAYNYVNAGWPLSDEAALLLAQGLERQYKVMGKAHDEAIDNKLKGLKYLLDKDVSIDALQTSYSHTKNKQTNSTTSKNLSGGTNRLANK